MEASIAAKKEVAEAEAAAAKAKAEAEAEAPEIVEEAPLVRNAEAVREDAEARAAEAAAARRRCWLPSTPSLLRCLATFTRLVQRWPEAGCGLGRDGVRCERRRVECSRGGGGLGGDWRERAMSAMKELATDDT